MPETFQLKPHSSASFTDFLTLCSHREGSPVVELKSQVQYLVGYLDKIGAKTILLESEYVDRDFLEDFAGYYVRCFEPYRRYCSRLHFFSFDFGREFLEKSIVDQHDSDRRAELRRNYLGFIVVKPLPETIIGRTCLVTYPENAERYFPITRKYDVDVFGISLTVDSLAFQEQDHEVAACATSALWSVFHASGKLFQHQIPSPFAITKIASELTPDDTRALPNEGLSTIQMANSIRDLRLEPLAINVEDPFLFKSALYAYTRGRIPVLLVVDLLERKAGGQLSSRGMHGVAVAGYSLPSGKAGKAREEQEFQIRAESIDRIYAHDDQIGPFSRLIINDDDLLLTSWKDEDGNIGNVFADPILLLVPLYHKIRVPFANVLDTVRVFDSILRALVHSKILRENIEWDIFIDNLRNLRGDIVASDELFESAKYELVTKNLSRFVWRAIARNQSDDRVLMEMVFDATALLQGPQFLTGIGYDSKFVNKLAVIAAEPDILALFPEDVIRGIFQWLRSAAIH